MASEVAGVTEAVGNPPFSTTGVVTTGVVTGIVTGAVTGAVIATGAAITGVATVTG